MPAVTRSQAAQHAGRHHEALHNQQEADNVLQNRVQGKNGVNPARGQASATGATASAHQSAASIHIYSHHPLQQMSALRSTAQPVRNLGPPYGGSDEFQVSFRRLLCGSESEGCNAN